MSQRIKKCLILWDKYNKKLKVPLFPDMFVIKIKSFKGDIGGSEKELDSEINLNSSQHDNSQIFEKYSEDEGKFVNVHL